MSRGIISYNAEENKYDVADYYSFKSNKNLNLKCLSYLTPDP